MYINADIFIKNIGIEKNSHNDLKLLIKYEMVPEIK